MPPKGKKGAKSKAGEEEALTRIAIVTAEKCKPKKCNQECKKSCPVVKLGKLCIEVTPKSKLAFISEPLCIGECQIGSSVSVPSRQPHPKDVSFSHPDTPFFSSHQASKGHFLTQIPQPDETRRKMCQDEKKRHLWDVVGVMAQIHCYLFGTHRYREVPR